VRLHAAIVVAIVGLSSSAWAANVTRDGNGYTLVADSSDTVDVYVSTSGSDSNSGLSPSLPKRHLSNALALIRNGKPDHLYLKAGDTWTDEGLGLPTNFNGRGSDEPIVISSYSTGSTTRPRLQTSSSSSVGSFISRGGSGTLSHVYIIGLDFYDAAKDPASGNYAGAGGGSGGAAPCTNGITIFDAGSDLLIEDNWFHFFEDGINIAYVSLVHPTDIVIRRNVITDQYNGNPSSCGGHAQGAYIAAASTGTFGTIFEENWFDMNAWNVTGGQPADVFNHHVYIEDSTAVTARGNIFGRSSSLSLKFVQYGRTDITVTNNTVAYNNFFFQGEVGISMANGTPGSSCDGTGCITNSSITWNVLSQTNQSNPTGRSLGWGIEMKNNNGSVIEHNLFTDYSYTNGTFAIAIDDDTSTQFSGNLNIDNNVIYRMHDTGILVTARPTWSNIKIFSNVIQDPDQGQGAYEVDSAIFTPFTFTGNTYSLLSTSHFWTDGSTYHGYSSGGSNWLGASSEAGPSTATTSFPAPSRNLDSYAASIGLTNAAGYLAAIRTVSRNNPHPQWMAAAINDYMRAGFGMAQLNGGPTITVGRAGLFLYGGF